MFIHALVERQGREEAQAPVHQKVADAITSFTGSMRFVYLHLLVFGFWIVANLQWFPGISPWDESFVVLAMIASVEAIFLSTFVLISQNRMAAEAEKRAELDLQISLLTEHEITKVVALLNQMAAKFRSIRETKRSFRKLLQMSRPSGFLTKSNKPKLRLPSNQLGLRHRLSCSNWTCNNGRAYFSRSACEERGYSIPGSCSWALVRIASRRSTAAV